MKTMKTMKTMKIDKNTAVKISFKLMDIDGKVLNHLEIDEPIEILIGNGDIAPGLEAGILGLRKGDKKSITVEPKDGYGEDNPELRIVVSRSDFPKDVDIQPGFAFLTELENGEEQSFIVSEIDGDEVKIDGNHPLSGETLTFDIEVISVRAATDEELSHGHIHGEHCQH